MPVELLYFPLTFTIGWLKPTQIPSDYGHNVALTFTIGWLKPKFGNAYIEKITTLTFTIGWLKLSVRKLID